MNPIHEAGFASLVVLVFATAPAFVAALVAALVARFRPKASAVAAAIAAIVATLVLVLAAVTTAKLHARIDFWIDTGGYGPPADVRRTYGPDWHASARLTAWIGIVVTALPLSLAALGYRISRRGERWSKAALVVSILVGLAEVACLVMALV
ncbi:hypothetical protein KEG38_52610 [Polyangium jinanense]|uniref:hypothetical protein n=1 Tax=Polyangium jinanense TaxID=2829994 RepID=UPI002340274F|nr:hypothetical protein [Polyangium jinanense]MDC3962568.1 hypothetical protein [Polyangium jinanense]